MTGTNNRQFGDGNGVPKDSTDAFQVPADGLLYLSEIVERCEDLIHHHIWSGIHISRLKRWLANFKTDKEKYFAACVLDALIYRSQDQTIALIKQLFQRILPDLARLDPIPDGPTSDWTPSLKKGSYKPDPGVRLVTVVRQTDPPTKSAYIIARFMKQYLSIDEAWIIKPWDMQRHFDCGIKVFVFIDDFLGTGDQFIELIGSESLQQLLRIAYCAYVPLAAHVIGITALRNAYPDLRVRTVERLDSTHSLFNASCTCFEDSTNNREIARFFYYDLLRIKGINIEGPNRRGYGHLELAYSFSHATPDNCLPILWWKKNPAWNPLFDR
jgi:hypothetical protein